MMDAVGTPETLVYFHKTTRRYIPESSHPDTWLLNNIRIVCKIVLSRTPCLLHFIVMQHGHCTVRLHAVTSYILVTHYMKPTKQSYNRKSQFILGA
jgi:hypothetical protein